MMKTCTFCRLPAELMCGRCLEVYCSFACQLQDWSDHKRICVDVPQLFTANSLVATLAGGGGMTVHPRSSVGRTARTSRNVPGNNGRRSLTPLRKPHFYMGVDGVPAHNDSKTVVFPDVEPGRRNPESAVSEKVRNISVVTTRSNKRMVKIEVKEEPRAEVTETLKPEESVTSERPKVSAKMKLEMLKKHKKVLQAPTQNSSVESNCRRQPKTWMLHFPLEKEDGEMFGVVVQCVPPPDQPTRCWVILADHETQCNTLFRDINGQVNPNGTEPVRYDDVQVDEIYTAPYDGDYYRVMALEKIDPAKSLVKVRLIDYGNELILPAADLRAPVPLMKNLRAFAFLIEIRNLNRPLELGEAIRITIIRSESDRKIVEMEQTRLSLLHWLGNSTATTAPTGKGRIVATFSSRKALVLLVSDPAIPIIKTVYTELLKMANSFALVQNPKVGDLVCVNSAEVGWSRAVIIQQHEGYQLVFTVDYGSLDLINVQEVRSLPEKFKHQPWLALKMEVSKVVTKELDFKRMCYIPSFEFTYEQLSYRKTRPKMKCAIKDAEGKRVLAEVEFTNFECDLKKVGIHYWPHIPRDKSIVRITFSFDVSTVVVCPKDTFNIYTELLQTVLPNLKPLTGTPDVKDVIVAIDDSRLPYRALVLSNASTTDIELLDLDSGIARKTVLQNLYESNGFVQNLPVHTVKVHILDMNVSAIEDQACVLDQLVAYITDKREFRMHFEGGSYVYGVKLIDVTTNRSLAAILSEHHDQKIRNVVQLPSPEQRLAVSEDPEKQLSSGASAVLTINDLKFVSLPTGQINVKLTILDDGALGEGLLTVCELTEENMKRYITLTDEVNRVATECDGAGYSPKLDELCLAVFEDDKMWYRAVCLQPQPGKQAFVVQFIDYGNMAVVKRESIRSLPKELAFPCVAHTCAIKDPKPDVSEMLTRQQATLGYVVAQKILFEKDAYSLLL